MSEQSPISLDDVLAGTDAISQVRATRTGVHWLASIATEDGRVTVRRLADGQVVDLTPDASVRSRVMEYGGGAYDVGVSPAGEALLAYCDDVTRQVWLLAGEQRRPLTLEQTRFRYGGLHLVPERRIVVAVREDHDATPEARTEIVSLDLDSDNNDGGTVLATGADFYAGPTVKGHRLAWFQWMHPNMSWDSAEVMLGSLDDPSDVIVVAGGDGVSAQHPMWLQGALAWTSDETGFWNWYHGTLEGRAHFSVERDCDVPTWVLDAPPASVVNDDLIATIEISNGAGTLALWQPSTGGVTRPLPGTAFIDSVSSVGEDVFVIASWPDRPDTLVQLSPTGRVTELVGGDPLPGAVIPTSRWSEGEAGPVQSWFYSPGNVTGPPPMLVMTHGGPTSARDSSYNREVQYWVSRGFAVLDVNYSGSTGFGRAYRDRLKLRWGLLDVSDVVAAVREVTDADLADPARVAITGGSAGGYTTLQALVSTDVFAAGMSSYGIADLRTLATDTHKAESRYPDSLVGPWPEAEDVYLERSPITKLDSLSTPMLILQGMDDKVVPPNQAFDMAEAVRAKGKPLALLTFDGEGHGFRSMAARRAALEAKTSFLQQVFELEHSPDVHVLEIENLN